MLAAILTLNSKNVSFSQILFQYLLPDELDDEGIATQGTMPFYQMPVSK